MKKLLFLTGSRGEWGYIRPILRLAQMRDDVETALVVTNMHLLPGYGNSYREIENDGFRIDHKIRMAIEGAIMSLTQNLLVSAFKRCPMCLMLKTLIGLFLQAIEANS